VTAQGRVGIVADGSVAKDSLRSPDSSASTYAVTWWPTSASPRRYVGWSAPGICVRSRNQRYVVVAPPGKTGAWSTVSSHADPDLAAEGRQLTHLELTRTRDRVADDLEAGGIRAGIGRLDVDVDRAVGVPAVDPTDRRGDRDGGCGEVLLRFLRRLGTGVRRGQQHHGGADGESGEGAGGAVGQRGVFTTTVCAAVREGRTLPLPSYAVRSR
jgi:hypothetical protein